MSDLLKREGITWMMAILAGIMFIEFFLDIPAVNSTADALRTWSVIISTMALGLGIINFLQSYIKTVQKRVPGQWQYRLWSIFLFVVLTILGLINKEQPIYQWVFSQIYTPLGQTMYAITGIYIFSAAYRAFRARTIESAVLLIAGCFILLTNAPVGEVIYPGIPVVGNWIFQHGQQAAMTAFRVVGGLGILAYGFRVLLGRGLGITSGEGGGEE